MVTTETRNVENVHEMTPAPIAPDYSVQATTEAGRYLVGLAEKMAAHCAGRAAEHDREGSFPYESLALLKASRFLYAPVPLELGGLGVESVHDVLTAASRIARGDASLAIGVNMHLTIMLSMARLHRIARSRGDEQRREAIASMMERFARSGAVIAAAVSEPGQDLTRQSTKAGYDGSRWVINGRKIISSMAPAATHFSVSVDYTDGEGTERYAFVIVPADAPGVKVHDDWDALGMRASASVSITFEDCAVPGGIGRGAVAGTITPEYLEQFLVSGAAHAAASVGIIETAHQISIDAVARRRERAGDGAVRSTARHLAAENSVDVSASRAIFERALRLIDQYYEDHPTERGALDEANAIFSEVQQAKAFVNQASLRVVDRAMTIAGGGAYMSSHPLSRLYRDARAGAFMHPLGANVAYEYIGAVSLGMRPESL